MVEWVDGMIVLVISKVFFLSEGQILSPKFQYAGIIATVLLL
jgi:hypothetical protein